MTSKLKIIFDFDGTLCNVETIPHVAKALNITHFKEIIDSTNASCISDEDYEANLRKRISMMNSITVSDFTDNVTQSLLRKELVNFILNHKDICEIASCNLDCWCSPLLEHLGIPCHLSKAILNEGHVAGLEYVTDKEAIVKSLQTEGHIVVFIGDSANDLKAMRHADFALLLSTRNTVINNIGSHIHVSSSVEDLLNNLESILNSYDNFNHGRTEVR